jgi:8-oxo-dGTP pyrophosphatase MutT (NUDIX family)
VQIKTSEKWVTYSVPTGVILMAERAGAPRLLLLQRAPQVAEPHKWDIPAGFPEDSATKLEQPLLQAQRKVQQEIGMPLTPEQLQLVYNGVTINTWYWDEPRAFHHSFYVAMPTQAQVNQITLEPEKFIAMEWVTPQELNKYELAVPDEFLPAAVREAERLYNLGRLPQLHKISPQP